MIVFENVEKGYINPETNRFQSVLRIDDYSVPNGRHLAVSGPSGTGKTTLLHLISGLLKPEQGQITINNVAISGLSESERDRFRADNIGYVFQSFNLLDGFTALENVKVGLMFSGKGAKKHQAEHMLDRVGLADRMHYKPSQLSVGQQQRVCIARALVNNPDILLADEPTGNLDPATSAEVLQLLKETAAGKILITVTHEQDVINQFDHQLNIERFTQPSTQEAV